MQFQPIQYTFSKGRHAKVDPFGLQPPYLKEVENMVTHRIGEWQTRTGYENIDTLSGGKALFTLDTSLVAITNNALQSYSTTGNNFVDQGAFYNFSTAKQNTSIRAALQSDPQVAAGDNKILTMWVDLVEGGNQTIHYKITGISGEIVVEDTVLASSLAFGYSQPRCWAMSNRFVLTYKRDTDDHVFFTFILFSDTSYNLAPALDIGIKKQLQGEYTALTNQIAITYIDGANNHRGAFLSNTGFTLFETTISSDTTIDRLWITTRSVAFVPQCFIAYHDVSTTAIRFIVTNSTMGSVIAPTTIETAANLDRPMAIFNGTAWRVYWTAKGGASESVLSRIKTTTVSTGGTVGALATYLLNRVNTGSPIFIGTDLYIQSYRYGTYPGYELLIGETSPTKINDMENISVPATASIFTRPAVNTSNNSYYFPQLSTLSRFRDSSFNLLPNVVLYSLNENPDIISTKAVKSLFLTSSQLTVFDGQDVFEASFPIPDDIVSEISAGATLTVRYCYTFTFTDANGVEVESSPSTDLTVTTNDPSGSNVTIEVRTLKLTRKPAERVKINLYRTNDNGTSFFLAKQASNDSTVDTITIVDDVSEATLATRPALYTEGNVLENDPIPECTFVKQLGNRIFFVPSSNTNQIGYTKLDQYHASPVDFRITIDQSNDDNITALAELNGNLVIFKNDLIYILTGTGPDNTGQNDDFSVRRVPTDVGCIQPRSIAQLRDKVMFKSRSGLAHIDRGENVDHHHEMEDFDNQTVNSASVYAEYHEVRFTTVEGFVMVYQYEFEAWSVFTNYNAASAVLWPFTNKYYHIREDGAVLQERKTDSITDYNDDGSAIRVKFRTPWLWFEHKSVRKRTKRAAMLASYIDGLTLFVGLHTDFVDGLKETAEITFDDLVAYSGGNYGAGTYGGGAGLVELRRKLRFQKAKSYSLEVRINQLNHRFYFSGMEWETGLKTGLKDAKAA